LAVAWGLLPRADPVGPALRSVVLLAAVLAGTPAFADHEGKTVVIGEGTAQRRFLVGRKLGFGCWSNAYAGTEHGSGKRVAIKIWRDERRAEGLQDSYDEEHRVLSLASGASKAVLVSHGTGHTDEADARRAMGTELREQMLTQLIAGGPLPTGKAVRIAMRMLRGVRAFERLGLRHHDLKPDNIFIDGARSRTTHIGDVGNARPVGQPAPGRPTEYPPTDGGEAVNDDVHAVASMLVDMLVGRIEAVRNPELAPAPLQPILARALHADPQQRFATAQELLDALAPLAED
jgi:serine/threonine protein kinase